MTIELTKDDMKKISQLAKEENVSEQEVISRAIDRYVERRELIAKLMDKTCQKFDGAMKRLS